MRAPDASLASRWLFALKPASWPKIGVPLLFGLVLGVRDAGSINVAGLVVVTAFAVADLVFIVLLNDWADREIDALKRRLFPDAGSPKAIIDGILPARAILTGGLLAGGAAAAVAVVGRHSVGGVWFGVGAFVCLGLFVAYSLPPVRLNYRGGGELLEAIGIGGALPWLAAYSQTGEPWSASMWMLVGLVALSLSSAVASGLSDEISDLRGGKRTVVTFLGNPGARRVVEGAVLIGAVAWVIAAYPSFLEAWVVVPPAVFIVWRLLRLRRTSAEAVTNAFGPLRKYKSELHMAIWEGALFLSCLLVVHEATANR